MQPIQLNVACEGPLALNNNAFELCRDFLPPDGVRFFTQMSRYGDYLANLAPKPAYRSGDILKLILPFLKAAGLTTEKMAAYSREHLSLMPRAGETYRFLHALTVPIFAVSSSYSPFAAAVGARLGFAPERLFSTRVDLDSYELTDAEAGELRSLLGKISAAPAIELPPEARTLQDLSPEVQGVLSLFDTIFVDTIPHLSIGRMYQEINIMGGPEKAQAVEDSLARTGLAMADLMYVGDNRTDMPAMDKVRAGGGVTLSFNGDRHAVRAADIIVVADTTWPVALLLAVFLQWGKEGVVELAQSTRPGASKYLAIPESMIEPIMMGLQEGKTFNLYHPGTSRREEVIADSTAMRRRLRGEAIAAG
jgi:energy-converting hydrogenase A subunit R